LKTRCFGRKCEAYGAVWEGLLPILRRMIKGLEVYSDRRK
jgi:hypothetical protein